MISRCGFRLVGCPDCGRFACMFGDRKGLKWFLELDGAEHGCWLRAKMEGRYQFEASLRARETMYDVLAVGRYLPDGVAAPQPTLWDDDG